MISYEGIDFYSIPNIEKYYISKCGKVLSTKSCNGKYKKGKEYRKLMKLYINEDGYLNLDLCINKKKFGKKIHRLVAETFLVDFDEKLQVDHIDNDKLNNDLTNLRMVTRSENQRNKKNALGYRYDRGALRAHWCVEKCKVESQSFSINKYGVAFALLLATNVRDEMVDKYYNRV